MSSEWQVLWIRKILWRHFRIASLFSCFSYFESMHKTSTGFMWWKHSHESACYSRLCLMFLRWGKANRISCPELTSLPMKRSQVNSIFFRLSAERVPIQWNDQKFNQSNDGSPVPPLPRTKFPKGQREGQPWNENGFVTPQHLPLRAYDVLDCEPKELPPKISILSSYSSISLPQRNTR